jgi:hypothetical protein
MKKNYVMVEDTEPGRRDAHGNSGDGLVGRYGTCSKCEKFKVVGPLDAEPKERRCITPAAMQRLPERDRLYGCEAQRGPRPNKKVR